MHGPRAIITDLLVCLISACGNFALPGVAAEVQNIRRKNKIKNPAEAKPSSPVLINGLEQIHSSKTVIGISFIY